MVGDKEVIISHPKRDGGEFMEKKWLERTVFTIKEEQSFERSSKCCFKEIDISNKTGIFQGGSEYITSLDGCSCPDYRNSFPKLPCKHMFCLAKELGYFKGKETLYTDNKSSYLDLAKNGELLTSQYSLHFNEELCSWIFGLNMESVVYYGKKKKKRKCFVGFVLTDVPMFVIAFESEIGLDEGTESLYSEPEKDDGKNHLRIIIKKPDYRFEIKKTIIVGEKFVSVDIFNDLNDSNKISLVLGECSPILKIEIPKTYFFKECFIAAYSEMKGKEKDDSFISEVCTIS